MYEENIKIRFVGNLQALPRSLQQEIDRSIKDTKDNRGIEFTVATNYGGRQEIIQACRAIAHKLPTVYCNLKILLRSFGKVICIQQG